MAAAKYARAERELKPARVYGTGSLALYEKADIKAPEDKKKHLIIGVSSDRGLCGAIHSSVAKQMKNEVAALTAAGKEVMIVGVGEKIKGILYRTHSDQFLVSFKDVGRKPPTFGDASVPVICRFAKEAGITHALTGGVPFLWGEEEARMAVSYTHLTLPTNREV